MDGSNDSLAPVVFTFTNPINLAAEVSFKCTCLNFSVVYEWIANEIDPLTRNFLQKIQINSTNSVNQISLNIPNASLPFGLYQIVFQAIVISPPDQFISNTSSYIQVVPATYMIEAISQATSLSVGPLDSISFVPAAFSIDPNSLVDPSSLNYSYYCILTDSNTNLTSSFDQSLYSIQPNAVLSQDQMNAANTCFKSSSINSFSKKINFKKKF